MKNKWNKNLPVVKQANAMIQGRQTISLAAKRIVIFGGKKIDPHSKKPNEVRVSFEEYVDFVDTREADHWKGRKKLLKRVFKNLNDNPLVVDLVDEKTGKRYYGLHNWIQSLSIDEKTEEMIIVYTDEVRKFFIYLQNQPYTNTLYEIGQYKSLFTVRIKEMIELEQFKYNRYFDISLEQLKWQLGVEKKYDRFYDFRRYVLEAAQNELKEHNSPVQFTFETLGKRGTVVKRRVQTIRFYPIFAKGDKNLDAGPVSNKKAKSPKKPAPIVQDYSEEYPAIFKKLDTWGIDAKHINRQIEQKGIERVQAAIALVESKPNVRSTAGLYMRAIEENWETDAAKKKKQAQAIDKKQKQLARQQQAAEAHNKAIQLEETNRMIRICDTLLAENEWLLDTAYRQAVDKKQQQGGSITLQTLPPTAAATYAHNLHRWLLIATIQDIFPERFSFTFEEWRQERPLQYKDMVQKATQHYEKHLQQQTPSASKASTISALLQRKFDSLYPKIECI